MNFYDVLAAEKWGGGIPTIKFFDLLFAQSISAEPWQTYEGTLPATLNANGDDMRQYQIYGASGGVGDEVDITGLSEPLCGIGAYTDSLDLSTGTLTRRIKKMVLTGEENWTYRAGEPQNVFFIETPGINIVKNCALCTHYSNQNSGSFTNLEDKHLLIRISKDKTKWYLGIRDSSFTSGIPSVAILKSYLAAQYAAETPVTVWYVLAEPEVSTITIPSGLTGTLEGYLIQDGTPTPETPIYPTANGEKQADDTYSIPYGYKLDMSVSDGTNTTTVPMYISDDPLDKDEYVDYAAQKVYRRTDNLFNIDDLWDKGTTVGGGEASIFLGIPVENGIYTVGTNVPNNSNPDIASVFVAQSVTTGPPSSTNGVFIDRPRTITTTTGKLYIGIRVHSATGYQTFTKKTFAPYYINAVSGSLVPTTAVPYLQPTDPPVPLPALPTCEGTTIVDYAGSETTAPEKVYFEYQGGEQP